MQVTMISSDQEISFDFFRSWAIVGEMSGEMLARFIFEEKEKIDRRKQSK